LRISTPKVLTYDTALLYRPRSEIDVPASENVRIGVCPGIYSRSLSEKESENYVDAHAKALDRAIADFGCSIVFIPHYISGFPNDDLDVSKRIYEKMENKDQAEIVKLDGVNDFKNYLNCMDIVISSKMHPAILAATGFVPVLCIVYDHKQSSFFERLNMVDCTLGIREVSYESLWSRLDYVFNHTKDLKKSLKIIIPKWQKNVQDAIQNTVKHYVKSV
jgi:polysaccharide pyruvyl transferase WcaK-like protein